MPEKTGGNESGGGIHVQAGSGFRISNLSLSFDKTTGELSAPDVQTEVRTDIFQHWLQIAQEASGEAEDARASALDAHGDDTEEFGKALGRDFRASLTAIAAAAFAIDAFYASAVHQAPDINVSCKTRDASIFETLKRGFSLTPAQQKALREPLRNLFRLRDNAVHPGAAWATPVRHPAFKVGMDPKFVNYSAESAAAAALLARQLIWTCVQSPKHKYKELAAWSEGRRKELPEPPLPDGWTKPSGRGH